MPKSLQEPRKRVRLRTALLEVAFIIFLFYANLLMGEFTGINGRGKTLALALEDIFTPATFAIALASACAGFAGFQLLRRKL